MTTVSGTNIKEIPDIIDTVVKHKATVFAFARYCPTSDEKDTNMTPQEYKRLLEICDAKFKAYEAAGCETYFNKKDHLWTLYEYEHGEFTIPEDAKEGMIYGGCNCGNCHMTILPNGDIYACRRVQNSQVSNVFTDRLADVWICQMESYREYEMFEKCSSGGAMNMNLRCDNYFVEDEAWHEAEGRFGDFVSEMLSDKSAKVVLLELGVGFNTPTIIRFPFEKLTREHENISLIRLNLNDAVVPESLGDRAVGINADMKKSIEDMKERIK